MQDSQRMLEEAKMSSKGQALTQMVFNILYVHSIMSPQLSAWL